MIIASSLLKPTHSVASLLLPSVFRPRISHPFIGLSSSFHSAVQEEGEEEAAKSAGLISPSDFSDQSNSTKVK